MDDQFQLPDLGPIMAPVIIGAVVLFVLWFPFIAAVVAPDGRRAEFFLLTLFVLIGPLGVGCAAVASPRPDSHVPAESGM